MNDDPLEGHSALSDSEADAIIVAALESAPNRSLPQSEIESIVGWANGVRIMSVTLDMVIDGRLTIKWAGDDVLLGRPSKEQSESFRAAVTGIKKNSR